MNERDSKDTGIDFFLGVLNVLGIYAAIGIIAYMGYLAIF